VVALSRIALPQVATIEVDWQQYGPKLAQVALTFGANHLDRVSLADDPALGRRRSNLADVQRNIIAAGFTPLEQGSSA
jgi:2-iminoacetate synthase ThiH